MPTETNNRETGARVLKELTGPDPHDDFSQKAAENKKPRSGVGLTQPIEETHAKTLQSDAQEQRSDDREVGRARGE